MNDDFKTEATGLVRLALELAYEVKSRCNDSIHDEQIGEIRALQARWEDAGYIRTIGNVP